jgi:hypothetical protein
MTTSYSYDSQYDPAAPVVQIGLSPSGQTITRQELTALIDSGADATMIPIDMLITAGARYVEQRRMRGVVGEAIRVNLYLTAVHIGNHVLHGIRAIGTQATSEAIIGRDVHNQLEVVLNGPALETLVK